MTSLRPTWQGASLTTDATFSPCGRYRYDLTRQYDPSGPWCLFIGLNPSTADATKDDPTIRREIDFAHGFGYPNLAKCNLYALRSTDPEGLRSSLIDPVGPENDAAIYRWVLRAKRIVFAWGFSAKVGKRMLTRAFAVRVVVRRARAEVAGRTEPPDVYCLGLTEGKERQPRHPLYLPKDTPWTRLDP